MGKDINSKSGFATAALVLGIIGVVLSFIPIINNAAFVLGALALIFAIVALVKKKSIATAVAAFVLAVASMGTTLAMQKSVGDALEKVGDEISKTADDMSGNNTEDILKNDVQVDLGQFEVIESEYGLQSSKLVVSVNNKMSKKKSFSIQIEAVDADGKRLADDTIYANDLNAGQSQDFEAFTLVQSDKYESLKTATFKIVSVSKV
ncbi:MAG TPA: FxLYD domain-containing protein [Candidatus Saccharibacteria bacterium]|nr:FxLYD domain-containing protein [Candidatus Saccharibacteria bacterium]